MHQEIVHCVGTVLLDAVSVKEVCDFGVDGSHGRVKGKGAFFKIQKIGKPLEVLAKDAGVYWR